MSFRIAQETLESLEWPQVVARLQAHCRTPQGHMRLHVQLDPAKVQDAKDDERRADSGFPFETSLAGALDRLGETSEARTLLDADEIPPISGNSEIEEALLRASRGSVLSARELRAVSATLRVVHDTTSFLAARSERSPRLADLASSAPPNRELAREIDRSIDADGEVSDAASAALADARRDASRQASEIQKRLDRIMKNSTVRNAMSDDYFTQRNGRYVLPVRSDSRGAVRGIVHDASRSGATLFVEPEGIVETGNRLKQAELTVHRETQRVLRELSAKVGSELEALRSSFEVLALLDLAFARGRLSAEMEAVEPEVGRAGEFDLPQLRHPLIAPEEAVPNDLRMGGDALVLVLSGPNGGGKTVVMKAIALAALFVRAGLHVPAAASARVDFVDEILVDIGDGQDIRESLSTFSAHMMNLSRIVRAASPRSLIVLDELGVGTDPAEGAALAQAVLEGLADRGARVVTTTHYGLLKEMADVDERFCNASFEFDPETLAPTYRIHMGVPGVSSAAAVAARMGMPSEVLDRANSLLQREDRQLDRMLTELATSRMALDEEQRAATRLRAEGEAVRDEYRAKLQRLQERRDKLFHSMREGLDQAFQEAHAEVANVIRELQRGGTAQVAGRAREKLLSLEQRAHDVETDLVMQAPKPEPSAAAIDWRHAQPGDAVSVPGGARGVLESLPDRHGRVRVRTENASLVLPQDRLAVAPRQTGREERQRSVRASRTQAAPDEAVGGGSLRCDLRGLRVEEALDRVAEALDRAVVDGRDAAVFIHGFGTGALRSAVREYLRQSPYVERYTAGDEESDTDGVTTAEVTSRRS